MDRSSDRDNRTSQRSRDDRGRDHKHRSSRDKDDKHHDSGSHRHHHRSERESHRDSHKSSSSSRRDDRERSREREKSYDSREDREGSRDRREHKPKRERSYDAGEVQEYERERKKKRERRRFGDKVSKEEPDEEEGQIVGNNDVRVDRGEVKVKEEVDDLAAHDGSHGAGTSNGRVSSWNNGAALESVTKTSSIPPDTSIPPVDLPTKVSSISNTNENKGVSITRSHEVHGKSSTDGMSSAAEKAGNLSLDAIAKTKLMLQRHKEMSERIKKKIPQMAKNNSSTSDGKTSSSTGLVQGSLLSTTVSAGAMSSTFTATDSVKPSAYGVTSISGVSATDYEAVKRAQELAAKMGFRQDPQFATLLQAQAEIIGPQKPTKAPVLRVDALGREIDEHGNVINVTKPSNLSTLKVNINKQKKDAFQILKPELDVDPESNPHFDMGMGINKNKILRPKRMTFQFVEEGKWSKDAEMMKLKSQFGDERAKDMKARQALHAKAKAAPDINPNLIEVSERVITKEKPKETIPEIEWWDVPLLPTGAYGEIIDGTFTEHKLKMEKITIYVEHPRPIEPPAEPAPPPPQPLKLTKKEQKKLRTQRRLAREKDKQEMIRQGLIEPQKPKVKMSNLMKVLGSEATQDPTRLEKEIRTAAAEREQAHIDRNIARKLTPAEKREKKERKLFDDPNTLETIVSVYKINDLSHKKTRFKVDVNAHENRLTGCGVIYEGMTVVVVEGGSKSVKRYGKLMLRRINWAEAVNEDEDEDDEEKPVNRCVLVWQGSVAKPSFNRFSMHECVSEAAARKFFADAGVGHYWDLSVNFSDE